MERGLCNHTVFRVEGAKQDSIRHLPNLSIKPDSAWSLAAEQHFMLSVALLTQQSIFEK